MHNYYNYHYQLPTNSNIQMQDQNWEQSINELLQQFNAPIQSSQLIPPITKDEEKRLKKRFKKYVADEKDTPESIIQKSKKLIDEISKNYQMISKQQVKVSHLQRTINTNKQEKDKAATQLKMAETLHKGFQNKYTDILNSAKDIEKEEQEKRKAMIEQLQNRIKVVQDEYEAAGKLKIQKYRENQTLKHEISKLEPQTATTESLYDAQLKKKQIQVDIQMTTLKQKIEMMNNFKNVSSQTKEKIEKAEVQKQKIQATLSVINGKEQEHKIILTKAHLVLEQYKNTIKKINVLLGKRQRQALQSKQKVKKAEGGLADIETKIQNLDKQQETQRGQIQMLVNLEKKLESELAE